MDRKTTALLAVSIAAVLPGAAFAHCDGMDGPVVKAAQAALAKGDVNPTLAWVQTKDEPEIRAAFARAQAVRQLGPQARELADAYFFETLVRVHRAGEGEPYVGLMPAGRDLGPAIPATDRALETGDADALLALLGDAVRQGLRERFQRALAARGHREESVEAGREYVERYVALVHYADALYRAATNPAPYRHQDSAAPGPREE